MDLEWLAVGKRCRLSRDEQYEFTVQDLVDYADIWLSKPESDEPRAATQGDIDALFGP